MAKITRKFFQIFGSNPGPDQMGVFGSLANNTPTYSTDPEVIQGLGNWLTGWFAAVVGLNSPSIEEMNSAMFVFAYQLGYMLEMGVPEWNAQTTYFTGSMVNSGGVIYISLQDTNLNHALTDNAWWKLNSGAFKTVTGTYSAALTDDIILANPTSASFQLTLPDCNTVPIGKSFTIKNIAALSSNNTVTPTCVNFFIDYAHSYQALNPGESVTIKNDGAVWWVL